MSRQKQQQISVDSVVSAGNFDVTDPIFPQNPSSKSHMKLDGQHFSDNSSNSLAKYQRNSQNSACGLDPTRYYSSLNGGNCRSCECSRSKMDMYVKDHPMACRNGDVKPIAPRYLADDPMDASSKMAVQAKSGKPTLPGHDGDFPKQ